MTYEQIQRYPVGMVYYREEHIREVVGYWYTDIDKKLIQEDPKLFNIKFNPDFSYNASTRWVHEDKIDGWLFDGEEWHCVELTWDGYQEIDDEDLLKDIN